MTHAPYRLRELGWLQFQQLADRLLPGLEWTGDADAVRQAIVPAGLPAWDLPGGTPALVRVAWTRGGSRSVALDADTARVAGARAVLVMTDADEDAVRLPPGVVTRVAGSRTLGELIDARADLRRRCPALLGAREPPPPLGATTLQRSAFDWEAAAALARVFVATGAYQRALDVLERHGFAVLTGPPEVGKTAIATIIGFAQATDGWQVHACIDPDEVRAAYDPHAEQVFVADDAFGSTEYRPEGAERWARELPAILARLDARHWLIWTSRPAPLRAALRRLHRERGAERFPAPGSVAVDASRLTPQEKVLILFRHARAAGLGSRATSLVKHVGWDVVDHPHFTPERVRRFVTRRLPELRPRDLEAAHAAVDAELATPTDAMAASLAALDDDHRALLVAMLDAPPGAQSERELADAVRRHHPGGLPRPPAELVDRLTDHFVRVLP